ncbi:hypothetical protein [Streptosporangium sp. NPDC048865]|uniref:hypothetical protein n=1 Tax=Streptosporangium sp. NPDC048865 TaxID=3155766 RepID=UPI0034256ED9
MATNDRPAVVLVHGAFAESGGWGPVAERLRAAGHRVDEVAAHAVFASHPDEVAGLVLRAAAA